MQGVWQGFVILSASCKLYFSIRNNKSSNKLVASLLYDVDLAYRPYRKFSYKCLMSASKA